MANPPPSSRFWAQLVPARMECPACSALLWFGSGGPALHQKAYDRITSRLTCPTCHRVWTLGIIAWATPAGRQTHGKAHPDQKLTLKQAATLREYARGFWADEKMQQDSLINRYLDGECCCWPLPWREDCPIHGKVRQEHPQPKAEDEEE